MENPKRKYNLKCLNDKSEMYFIKLHEFNQHFKDMLSEKYESFM